MSDSLPRNLGAYRLTEKLGAGGMGTVFRATQGTLERGVALKVLPPELARNPEYIQRFLREARAAAVLRHPNVVQVYDAGGTLVYRQPIARDVRLEAGEPVLWIRQIIGPGPAFDPEVCRRRSLETVNAVVEGDQVLFPQPGVGTGERGVILPADPDQLAALDAWDTWKLSGISAEEEADLDALDQD